jgi:hypothetical protein
MSFLRHAGIYRSDVVHKTITTWGGAPPPDGRPPAPVQGRDGRNYAPCSSSAMSSRAGYSLAGCSPAEPASASPTAPRIGWGITAGNELSANGNLSLVSVSQPRGSLHGRKKIPRIFAHLPLEQNFQASEASMASHG